MPQHNFAPKRHGGRIIIHFDYDCFYASVFEKENPALQHLPFAVQQKQIIVTCNYEARRRGLHKLQLVREAKQQCPDVIIVLGEDLTRFRDASKELYNFLRKFSWNEKVERLGFDEVFMDVTDIIDYNMGLLNGHHLTACFFHLDRNDPTIGFGFDASTVCGHTFPKLPVHQIAVQPSSSVSPNDGDFPNLGLRLVLGSHFAGHVRHRLEEEKGYTCTVGISTNKLLSKLVGNLNKPKGQTTLVPPYYSRSTELESNVTQFIDVHDIGKIPGIGFKLAQKIRGHVLGRPGAFDDGLIYGGTKETVLVRTVRLHAGVGPKLLEEILGGSGIPKGIGGTVWGLLNGVDDSEVSKAKDVPQQISVEDSYIKLNDVDSVRKELTLLTGSLLRRMRIDLMSPSEDIKDTEAIAQPISHPSSNHWIAHPRTLRLTTRPRPPPNPDGSLSRSFTRISKSCLMPSIAFSTTHPPDSIITQIVTDSLLPTFRKLHPEPSGWDLSLINLCATNMLLAATDSKTGRGNHGRDIGRMFRSQENVLRDWRVDNINNTKLLPDPRIPDPSHRHDHHHNASQSSTHPPRPPRPPLWEDAIQLGSEDSYASPPSSQESHAPESAAEAAGTGGEQEGKEGEVCEVCRAMMPSFAIAAHHRFHWSE